MMVPEYWAEARFEVQSAGRSVTLQRSGWSDESESAAQAHAAQRAQRAADALLAGEDVPLRERRTGYGVEGVPIREEIVERIDDMVITRNSYGALCLNVPDVLFADLDFEEVPAGCGLSLLQWLVVAVLGFLAAQVYFHTWAAVLIAIGVAVAVERVRARWLRHALERNGGEEGRALARVEAFSSAHPDWHLRVYRTPAGLRVLVMHRAFQPDAPEVAQLFEALRTDRLYSMMCRMQNCFRARLTAKPWRIGIGEHIQPGNGVWLAEHATLEARQAWIAAYEQAAAKHAACRYLRSFGSTRVDSKAAQVKDLHDRLSCALQPLPLG